MYGTSTDQPVQFLDKCIDILRHYNLEQPSLDILSKYKIGGDEWGNAISDVELEGILDAYGVTFP